jgi:hypothetical protein
LIRLPAFIIYLVFFSSFSEYCFSAVFTVYYTSVVDLVSFSTTLELPAATLLCWWRSILLKPCEHGKSGMW